MTPGPKYALALALAAAAALVAVARPARAARGQTLTLGVAMATAYDDNILQYTDHQEQVFRSGTRPDRYSIRSLDDQLWLPELSLAWQLDQGRGRRHLVRAHAYGDFHASNSTADNHAFSLSWRESFRHERHLTLADYELPSFYLRQLVGEDVVVPFPGLSRYRRADFGLNIASAAWKQALGARANLELDYQFETRRYHADFRERDSGTHQARVVFGLEGPAHVVSGDVALGYRQDDARGSDADEPEAPPDADIGYHGPIAGAGGRWELVRRAGWRLIGDLDYEFGWRHYDSGRPTDVYHFGRRDALHAIEAGLRVALRPHVSARFYDRLEIASATLGVDAPPTSDVGSYRENQVGLTLEWTGEIWRNAREARDATAD